MTNQQKITKYVTYHAQCFKIRMTEQWMATIRLGDHNEWHLSGAGSSNLTACADLVRQIEKQGELKKWVLAQKRSWI